MTDDQHPDERGRPDPEGVRIIGADEAEAALEREDVARRRGPDDPRPGDRPGRPPAVLRELFHYDPVRSATEDAAPEAPADRKSVV